MRLTDNRTKALLFVRTTLLSLHPNPCCMAIAATQNNFQVHERSRQFFDSQVFLRYHYQGKDKLSLGRNCLLTSARPAVEQSAT